jgi:hypothetical protein
MRLDHVGALKRLSTKEHDLEDSQQVIESTGKDVGNCKRLSATLWRADNDQDRRVRGDECGPLLPCMLLVSLPDNSENVEHQRVRAVRFCFWAAGEGSV